MFHLNAPCTDLLVNSDSQEDNMIILNSDSQEDNMIILNGNTPANIYLFKVKNKNTRLTFHLFRKTAFLNLIKFWKYYGLTGE